MFHGRDWLPKASSRLCQNQGAGMQDTKVPWPTQCKSALSVLVTGTLNMGSSCFGDGVHFEQILSRRAELCVSVWSIVCRHCQNQGAGMQDTKVPWPTQCKSALSVLVTGTLNMGSSCFGDGVHFEQILSRRAELCVSVWSIVCRHCQNQGAGMQDTKVPWPTQCKSALSVLVTGTLNMGSSCFGDGVHFEQILSRRAELCVSVWSIVCRHCQNQGAGMQDTKVPWPTQCKSALSVLVTGTLNMGSSCFGDGVHFEQILSRRAELCVSVWSIVCRHCQNQGAGMQDTKVPWPTQCKSALSVLVTGTLNMGSSCFGDGVHFEQILSRRAELCVSVWSIVCRHCQNQGAGMQDTKVPWPTQCKSALSVLVTGTLNMGSSCFGDGVHFEQILSRRAELCVSVWSIVCRHCQNQGAGMQDKKVPWPTQCKSALSVLVTGTLNMGSSCFGDGVHFEQILSRKAELCVSVWSIVCRHCQNQGAGMQDTKVPWPTQCKSALSVLVTGTLNMGSSCFGDGVHFEQILSRKAELCVSVWSIVCRHCQNQGAGMQDTKVPWPTQCKSALSVLVTGTLNMGSSCFGDGVHFEQILSRRAELCVSVWSIVCRHCQNQGAGMQDTKVPWPTQCKSALSVLVTGTLNHGVILFRPWGVVYIFKGWCRFRVLLFPMVFMRTLWDGSCIGSTAGFVAMASHGRRTPRGSMSSAELFFWFCTTIIKTP